MMRNQMKIGIGLLMFIVILIAGCIEKHVIPEKEDSIILNNYVDIHKKSTSGGEEGTVPVCGNHIIEEGETSENCCIDVGCLEGYSCENNVCVEIEKYETQIILENDIDNDETEIGMGVANPSTAYCMGLGYKAKTVTSEDGGQHGICIFPDENECAAWNFYRGKCGQEWSYCELQGYNLKNLSQNEGWFRGSICVNKNGTEIGKVYDLMKLGGKRKNNSEIITGGVGVANPSAVYCMELGYKAKTVTSEDGGQHGICIFPDENECTTWNFYRGKCGQEWSYCKLQGYNLKNLSQNEGWFRGGICINSTTKKEINNVYDLMGLRAKVMCKR